MDKKPETLSLTKHAAWTRYGSLGDTRYRDQPGQRQDHTMVYNEKPRMHDNDGGGVVVVYGGRNPSGDILNECWIGWRVGFDASESWSWIKPPSSAWPNAFVGRYEHSAVAIPGAAFNSTDMYVFGGLKGSGGSSATSELWRIRFQVVDTLDAGNDEVTVTSVTTTGIPPSARYGHTAVLDEYKVGTSIQYRMLVFGGRDASGALADDAVYSLDLSASTPAWTVVTAATSGGDFSRYRHTAVMDVPAAYLATAKPRRMVVFGGEGASGLLGDTRVLTRCNNATSCLSAYAWESSGSQTAPPTARYMHSAVMDPQWNRMLVFGGDSTGSGGLSRTIYSLPLELPPMEPYTTAQAWQQVAADSTADDIEPRARHASIWNGRYVVEKTGEVYDPSKPIGQRWADMTSAPIYDQWTYPFYFQLPSGNVFSAGRSTRTPFADGSSQNNAGTRILDKSSSTDPSAWAWGSTRWGSFVGGSSAVMFEPGKIMKFGQPQSPTAQGHATVARIEFDAADVPTGGGWAQEALASEPEFRPRPRIEGNMTALPGGKVLVSGGRDKHEDSGNPFTAPQIWSPSSNSWSNRNTLSGDPSTRGYHSTAILTPDARLISAGGSRFNGPTAATGYDTLGAFTVFDPPYLYSSGTTYAPRPVLSSIPDTLLYGNCYPFSASSDSGIAKLSLIRPGSTTHAFNMDQYFVPLTFSSLGGGQYRLAAPANGNIAPPANALVFLTANTGQQTPSVGKWVTVGPRHDLGDAIAPARVTTLTSTGSNCSPPQRIRWYETADDSISAVSGRVRLHDVRWSTSSIGGWSQFANANHFTCEPSPRGPGARLEIQPSFGPGSFSVRHVSWDDRWPYTRSSALSNELTFTLVECDGGPYIDGEGGGGGGLSARRAIEESAQISTAAPAVPLLGAGADGEILTDHVRLAHPVRLSDGRIQVRLRRGAGGSTRILSAGLIAVDRGSESEIALVDHSWVAVARIPATGVTGPGGLDVDGRLVGDEDHFFVGDVGDSLSITLPALLQGTTSTPIYIDASGARSSENARASIELRSSTDTVMVVPRATRATEVVSGVGAGPVTLHFAGNGAVHAIGRLVPTAEALTVNQATLSTATHSTIGPLAPNDLTTGTEVTLVEGDTLTMVFAEPVLAEGMTRDYWLRVRGSQEGTRTTVAGRSHEAPHDPGSRLDFALRPGRPNPTRSAVLLPFTLPRAGDARLEVFDMQGRRVHEITRALAAGHHEYDWDLKTRHGLRLAPGVYTYRLVFGSERAERKLVVLP